jgi:Transposase, Mutator family
MARHADLELPDGRQRVVRHGHDPVRPIQTGIGRIEVSKPKARDRGATTADERIRYSSAILPKWARRTKSLDVHLPALYLRGVSTGDFQDVLTALLGKDAPNLSPSVIGRLKSEWEDEYRRWQTRDLSARRYVYAWADGVYPAGAHGAAGRVHAGADSGLAEAPAAWHLKPDFDRRRLRQSFEMGLQRARKVFLKASTIRSS